MLTTKNMRISSLALITSGLLIHGCAPSAVTPIGSSSNTTILSGTVAAAQASRSVTGVVQNNLTVGAKVYFCKHAEQPTADQIAEMNAVMAGTADCPTSQLKKVTITDSDGNFSVAGLDIGVYTIISKGGTYKSEVDGSTVTAETTRVVVYFDGTKTTAAVTPLAEMASQVTWTTMAASLQEGSSVASNLVSSAMENANLQVATLLGLDSANVDFIHELPANPNIPLSEQGISTDSPKAHMANLLVSFEKARIDEKSDGSSDKDGYKPIAQRMANALVQGTPLTVDAAKLSQNLDDMSKHPERYNVVLGPVAIPSFQPDPDKIALNIQEAKDKALGVTFNSAAAIARLQETEKRLGELQTAIKDKAAYYDKNGIKYPTGLKESYSFIQESIDRIEKVITANPIDIDALKQLAAVDFVARANGFFGSQAISLGIPTPQATSTPAGSATDAEVLRAKLVLLYSKLKDQYYSLDKMAGEYVAYSKDVPLSLIKGIGFIKDFMGKVNEAVIAKEIIAKDAIGMLTYDWVTDLNTILGKLESPAGAGISSSSSSSSSSSAPSIDCKMDPANPKCMAASASPSPMPSASGITYNAAYCSMNMADPVCMKMMASPAPLPSYSSSPAPSVDCKLPANMVLPVCMAASAAASPVPSSSPTISAYCMMNMADPSCMVNPSYVPPAPAPSPSSSPTISAYCMMNMADPSCMMNPSYVPPAAAASPAPSSSPTTSAYCMMNMADPSCMVNPSYVPPAAAASPAPSSSPTTSAYCMMNMADPSCMVNPSYTPPAAVSAYCMVNPADPSCMANPSYMPPAPSPSPSP